MYYVLFWMVVLTFQLNFNKKSKMLIKQQIIVPKCLFSNGFFKNYILLFEIRYTLWGVRTNLNVHRRPIADSFNISWIDLDSRTSSGHFLYVVTSVLKFLRLQLDENITDLWVAQTQRSLQRSCCACSWWKLWPLSRRRLACPGCQETHQPGTFQLSSNSNKPSLRWRFLLFLIIHLKPVIRWQLVDWFCIN